MHGRNNMMAANATMYWGITVAATTKHANKNQKTVSNMGWVHYHSLLDAFLCYVFNFFSIKQPVACETMVGSFHLILGCMFSGKTTELSRRYKRYVIGGKKCVMIKYAGDTRYSVHEVATHDGIRIEGFPCTQLVEASEKVADYDVICIDEVQFYRDAPEWCDAWANAGKLVIACGLNGMFNREPFPIISRLIPLVESLTFLTAVCCETGGDAVYSQRLTADTEEELIGGSESYHAVDRATYFAKN